MDNNIKSVYEIKNDYFNKVSDYLESLSDEHLSQLKVINNYLIYINKDYFNNKEKFVEKIEKIPFLFNNKIVNDYKNCVEFLKNTFNIGRMWAMNYPPKLYLKFHKDHGLKRHVISFNENEMFFNYECYNMITDEKMSEYDQNLKNMKNDPLKYNEYFLNDNPKNRIINLEKNKIYSFGNCGHSFFNGATNKNRFNIVFEIID